MDLNHLFELMQEIREEQKEQGKTLTKLEVTFAKMEGSVEKNTEDLEYHIKRTDILEELHRDNAKRIERLEQPLSVSELLKKTVTIAAGIGVIASLIYTIMKIAGILK